METHSLASIFQGCAWSIHCTSQVRQMHDLLLEELRDCGRCLICLIRSDIPMELNASELAMQRVLGVGWVVILHSAGYLNPMLVDIKSNNAKHGLEGRKPGKERHTRERLSICTRICTGSIFDACEPCGLASSQVSKGTQRDLHYFWQLQSGTLARLRAILAGNLTELDSLALTTYIRIISKIGLGHFLEGSQLLEKRDSLLQLEHFLLQSESKIFRSNALQYLRDQYFTSVFADRSLLIDTFCLQASKRRFPTKNMCNSRCGSRCKSVSSGIKMFRRCLQGCGAAQNEKGPQQKPCCCNQYCTGGTACNFKKTAHHGWYNSSVFCAADGSQMTLAWLTFLLMSGSNSTLVTGDDVCYLELIRHSCVVPDGCRKCWNQRCWRFKERSSRGSSSRQYFSGHVSSSQEDTPASAPRRDLQMDITTKQAEVNEDQTNRSNDLVFYIFCGILAFTVVLGVFILLYTWLCKRRWRGVHVTSNVDNEIQVPVCS